MNTSHVASLRFRRVHCAHLVAPLVALGLWLFSASPAQAVEIPVSASCTITQAITAANTDSAVGGCVAGSSADTVVLTPTLYSLSVADNSFGGSGDNALPPITSTITISGNGATIARDLSFACPGGGDPEFRLLWVGTTGDLTLQDVTLRNGCVLSGGGLWNEGRTTLVEGSAVAANSAANHGGGLYNLGSMTLVASGVYSNAAPTNGGGLYNEGLLSVEGSEVYSNSAANGAGLFNGGGGTLTVTAQSEVYANTAVDEGGGLANINSSVTVVDSRVYSNTAANYGGGGLFNGGTGVMVVQGSAVYSNSTTNLSHGGGIRNDNSGAVLTITAQSEVYANLSTGAGGGVYNVDGSVLVQESVLRSNTSTDEGGGLYNSGSVIVEQSEVYSNTALTHGGGLYNAAGVMTVQGSSIYSNTAPGGVGGALYNDGSRVSIVDSNVYANTATDGGGLFNGSQMTVEGSAVHANSALTGNGGGLYNVNPGTVLTLTAQSQLYANSAAGSGGGLYNLAGVTVEQSKVYSNSAGTAGGGLYNDGGSITAQGSSIYANSASDGGALAQADGSSSVNASCIVGNSDTAVTYIGGTAPITATQNWWGAPSGPSGAGPGSGDSVSSAVDVDFTLFETAAILDCPTLEPPNMVLEKTAELSGTLKPGQTVTYTLHFTNTGERIARDVVVTDTLPAQVEVAGVSADVLITQTQGAPELVWEVEELASGADGTITLTVTVTETLSAGITLTNSALIAALDEIDLSDNSASVAHFVQVPSVQFESAAYSAAEDSGSATITVTLDAANPYADVTVDFTTADGTATAGDDYTTISSTLTISAGQSSAVFIVTLAPDDDVEEEETVNLTLSNPVGAALGDPDSATLTLRNDIPPIYLPSVATR